MASSTRVKDSGAPSSWPFWRPSSLPARRPASLPALRGQQGAAAKPKAYDFVIFTELDAHLMPSSNPSSTCSLSMSTVDPKKSASTGMTITWLTSGALVLLHNIARRNVIDNWKQVNNTRCKNNKTFIQFLYYVIIFEGSGCIFRES